ncbi:MAG: glutamate--tRNA ligase [Nanoarchaeota archaeon]|nr:glutamate--tRNA ligase [Nanoarchaeota archaeon]MBU1321392.1 glutamate--tRNA ligase [Nanoarchaeota archaeon]MBU1597452.1 glutamate--tRNA ligase [Nanoarchaeota archaeon]MBU2441359.1 glutamate--tRNA ligase [Nanoarchaeota archaeon]
MGLKEAAEKHALDNAVKFNGKANPKAVIGSVIQELEDEAKKDMKALSQIIQEAVKRINNLPVDEQKKIIKEKYPELLVEKIKEEKDIFAFFKIQQGDKVITAFPPGPEKYPHIGHAKALLLNFLLAKRYDGKFILRFEDTNPLLVKKEFYDIMVDNFKWMGVKWDELQYASDNMKLFYELAEKIINSGDAYMCSCDVDSMREKRGKGKPCACRDKPPKQNMDEWKTFPKQRPGSMVLRLKIDLMHFNSTMRDPTIFRIINEPHARLGKKYTIWPNYDFQNAIMDGYYGVTHRLRSKEFEMRSELQSYIQKLLGLTNTTTYEFARFNLKGVPSSGRVIREMINKGELIGWDDPRLATLVALRRRGFTPEAIENFVLSTGMTKSEATLTWDDLIVHNRRVLDEKSNRYFFVAEPVMIVIEDAPQLDIELHLHPEHRKGGRKFSVADEYYISREDYDVLKGGKLYRFMDCINFMKKGKKFVYDSTEYRKFKAEGDKIMHYLPVQDDLVHVEVTMPDQSIVKGLGEPLMADLKVGDIIQAERFGFMKLDKKEKDKLFFWYTHK